MGGGLFGSLFDLNGDGELDAFERDMEFMAFQPIMDAEEEENIGSDQRWMN